MILNIALVLAVTQMLSCVLIIKGHRNWNYLCYKFPYRGTKDGFSGFISKGSFSVVWYNDFDKYLAR